MKSKFINQPTKSFLHLEVCILVFPVCYKSKIISDHVILHVYVSCIYEYEIFYKVIHLTMIIFIYYCFFSILLYTLGDIVTHLGLQRKMFSTHTAFYTTPVAFRDIKNYLPLVADCVLVAFQLLREDTITKETYKKKAFNWRLTYSSGV